MNVMLYCSSLSKPAKMLTPVRERVQDQARRLGFRFVGVCTKHIPGCDELIITQALILPLGIFGPWIRGASVLPADARLWLLDDDCLYPDRHFTEPWPPEWAETFNYDLNQVFLSPHGFFVRHNRGCISNATAMARADVFLEHGRKKMAEARAYLAREQLSFCYEPYGSNYRANSRKLNVACLDIRGSHNHTWTFDRDKDQFFEDEPGWPAASEMVKTYCID